MDTVTKRMRLRIRTQHAGMGKADRKAVNSSNNFRGVYMTLARQIRNHVLYDTGWLLGSAEVGGRQCWAEREGVAELFTATATTTIMKYHAPSPANHKMHCSYLYSPRSKLRVTSSVSCKEVNG